MQKNKDYFLWYNRIFTKSHGLHLGCQQATQRESQLKIASLFRKSNVEEDDRYPLDAFLLPKTQWIISELAPDLVVKCKLNDCMPGLRLLVFTTCSFSTPAGIYLLVSLPHLFFLSPFFFFFSLAPSPLSLSLSLCVSLFFSQEA